MKKWIIMMLISAPPAACRFNPEFSDLPLPCDEYGRCPPGYYCPETGEKVCRSAGDDAGRKDAAPGDGPALSSDPAAPDAGVCVNNSSETCYMGPAGTENTGECRSGQRHCVNGAWTDCKKQILPAAETCDDADNDCDGLTDGIKRQCGTACGQGDETCLAGAWGGCTAPMECDCDPGDLDNTSCGNCGTKSRTCGGDRKWAEWSVCKAEGECARGAQAFEGCGNCGTKSRACANDCTWGQWSPCEGEKECAAHTTEEEECGNCSTRYRTCGNDCFWSGWGDCEDEGACVPSSLGQIDCGSDTGECAFGTAPAFCSEECEWVLSGICWNEVGPSTEICDGLDNDCDGLTDTDDSDMLECGDHSVCTETGCVCEEGFYPCLFFCCSNSD